MPARNQIVHYLEWCQYVKRRTPSTIFTKEQSLKRFVKTMQINDFTQVTNQQFDEFRTSLMKRGCAGKTINNYSDHVVDCIRWLVVHKKMPVALDFDIIERAEEDEPEILIYTEDEIARAIQACRGPRDDLLISLIFQTGLRLHETATLKVENIDGLAISVIGKNRHRRRTFIREDTKEKIDRWLALNQITEGYIFPSPIKWGSYLAPHHIREIIKAAFKRAGVEKRIHPHALRHTWFTTLLDSGAPLMDTAIMGGHTDPRTTRRYYHASPKRHAELHKKFIPQISELGTDRPVENRTQEIY